MKLFEPGRIGRLELKNRIVMAPMGIGGLVETDGKLSQRAIDYYVARAKGGTGLILTCAARVRRDIDQLPNALLVRHLMADNTVYAARFSELADAVHDYGAKVGVQLMAGVGRLASADLVSRGVAVAPSAVPCFADPRIMARELTIEEIEQIVQAFEFSARLLCRAGIDLIEINAHNGYLVDEFNTALWNRRKDKYGGDLGGRLRFTMEVIEAIKRGAGAQFPISYRLSLTHYLDGGRKVDEGLEIARRLEAAGVAALHVDAGCGETQYWTIPSSYQPHGCLVDLAEMVKKVVRIPVITVGKLGYPELAESVLREGKADFIALGRTLIADAGWPDKVKKGKLEDIRPCLGDNVGCHVRLDEQKCVSCTVNPAAGLEKEFAVIPVKARQRKSVLVIGGGPGGMEAARLTALRGHKVTLLERGDSLGGNLIPASVPHFKEDYRRLISYLSTQIVKLGVKIELGTEATPEMVLALKPGAVFVATGARPIIPDIPGIKTEIVATAIDVLLGRKEVGESVVVIGGGLIGCETALWLAQKGKKLTIVENLGAVARDLERINRLHLLKLLTDANINILTDTKVLKITNRDISIADKRGQVSDVEADTIVVSVGLAADRKLLESVGDKVPEVYAIGDCVRPRKLIDAIWEGFRLARLV